MPDIRVLFGKVAPNILSELLTRIASNREDMTIVGQNVDRHLLQGEIDCHRPDVIILGLEDGEMPRLMAALLEKLPDGVIVGIVPKGQHALIALGNVGSEQLVSTLRVAHSAAAPGRRHWMQ